MKHLFNILGIVANTAIIAGLVKDCCDRFSRIRKQDNNVEEIENDEV